MVWAVWTAILADKDKDGFTSLTPGFLAHQWSVSEDEVQKAWDVLAAPDPSSKNKDEGGRRIIHSDVFPGAWYVVSNDLYKNKWTSERRKEANRIAQKRSRLKKEGKLCGFKTCVRPTYGAEDQFCPEHSFEEDK